MADFLEKIWAKSKYSVNIVINVSSAIKAIIWALLARYIGIKVIKVAT